MIRKILLVDVSNYRPLKEGDVLFTLPYVKDEPAPEPWQITMGCVTCGPSDLWDKRQGCSAEIGYLADTNRPVRCDLCGGRNLQSCGFYGLMGVGAKPSPGSYDYRFRPFFMSWMSVARIICKRRREVRQEWGENDERVAILSTVLSGVVAMRRAEIKENYSKAR
jgi:hypothetical protein